MPISNTNIGLVGVTALLRTRRRLHFVGVGGVQMSALATLALSHGFRVTGSDASPSARVDALRARGARVCVGVDTALVANADALVYSLAIDEDHPEYAAAVALGLPVLSRAELLAFFTSHFACRVAVAGSHGKSSVTAMLANARASLDPTVIAGASIEKEGSALREGLGNVSLCEACEYRDSYLALSPTIGTLLSFDLDHVDYFANEAALAHSFETFASRCACLVANGEDATLAKIAENHPRSYTFGVESGDAHASELSFEQGFARFTLVLFGTCAGRVTLRVPGLHNVKNALASALVASLCDVPPSEITTSLSAFRGIPRRLCTRGVLRGVPVFDDYAHHPREVAASIAALRACMRGGRLVAVFEPHTYSRTLAFEAELASALASADRVFVANIYPARERDTKGMSAERLATRIGERASASGDLVQTARALLRELTPTDTLLVMSAGSIEPLFDTLFA